MEFRFPWYISLIPVAIALVPIAVALVLFIFVKNRFIKRFAALPFFLGLLIGAVFGPMLFQDQVKITNDGLYQTTGFWYSPTHKGFDFHGVKEIDIITETRDFGIQHATWNIHYEDGKVVSISPGDLWRVNTNLIVKHLEKLGITVRQSHA